MRHPGRGAAILAALAAPAAMAAVPAINPDGIAMTVSTAGVIDRAYPLFKPLGKCKTPELRALSARAPYFHDGSARTAEDVVGF